MNWDARTFIIPTTITVTIVAAAAAPLPSLPGFDVVDVGVVAEAGVAMGTAGAPAPGK